MTRHLFPRRAPPAARRPRRGLAGLLGDALGRWRGATAGSVSIELAALLIFASYLTLGLYDFGRFAVEKARIVSAARAGAQYGAQDQATAGDLTGMRKAAREDANDPNGELNITARQYCSCAGEGEVACGAMCVADETYAPMYVEVYVFDKISLVGTYPGIQPLIVVTSTATMRAR